MPKLTRWQLAIFILLLVFYGSFLARQIALPVGDDMARHLANGRAILAGEFEVIYENTYSYTEPGFRFVNHHWLSGVAYHLVHKIAGWDGLVIFNIAILLLAFSILFWTARKYADFWLVALFSVPTIYILAERTQVRPESFSYLFIALFLYLLAHTEEHPESRKIYPVRNLASAGELEKTRKPISNGVFWLVPLQILWVNLHIFFFLGPVLAGAFLLSKLIWQRERTQIFKIVILLAILGAACLANPHILAGALYPLNIFDNYAVAVSENLSIRDFLRGRPLLSHLSIPVFFSSAAVLAVSFLFGFRDNKARAGFYLFVSAIMAFAALNVMRALPLFALVFLPATSSNFNRFFSGLQTRRRLKQMMSLGFAAVLIFLIIRAPGQTGAAFGLGLTARSQDSAKFFQEQNIKGPIFNDFDIGSFLIYNLYPRERVFLDNRPEAYPREFLESIYYPAIASEDKWQEILEHYNFNAIFFYPYDEAPKLREFLWNRVRDPQWSLVYSDQYAMIFVRRLPENQEIINKFVITSQNAEEKLQNLTKSEDPEDLLAAADTFNLFGLTDLARQVFWGAVEKQPERGELWLVLGQWELGTNDPNNLVQAASFFEKALSVGYKTAETYSLLGITYAKLGELEKAKPALRKALQLNPNRQDAKAWLDALEKF